MLEPKYIEEAEGKEDTPNYHPHHDLIIKWAKGVRIQVLENNKWFNCPAPNWAAGSTYRIKPRRVTELEELLARKEDFELELEKLNKEI